jgi:hypothetical protein
MNLASIIFLCIITLLIGAAIGSLIENALKKRPVPPPPVTTSDVKLAGQGDVEVFSAWRTISNAVWLNMDGKRLNKPDELLPEQRRRLLGLVVDLRPWLETTRAASSAPELNTQPPQAKAPIADPSLPTAQPEKQAVASTGDEPAPAPVMDSIIEQIDKVLQTKLAASPFKERGIHLTEGPGGIVLIKDGVNKYEGVEAVPDPLIKSLIHQAVSDWEQGIR